MMIAPHSDLHRMPHPSTPDAGGFPARCVILGGGLQASPLQSLSSQSVLDVPITPGRSVLESMLDQVAHACGEHQRPPVLVVYGNPVPAPRPPASRAGMNVTITPERHRWRGPAGVVRDVCDDLPAEADILVLEGARWLGASLAGLLADHKARGVDATVAQSPDQSPAGAYLIRRSALDFVPKQGFLDLKEQLFGKLRANSRHIAVHTMALPGGLSLRTLEDLLAAARIANPGLGGNVLVDPAASVDPSAVVLDSIVMADADVGPRAVVARSLVLAGARIGADAEVVDMVVGPDRATRDGAARPASRTSESGQ
jgi:NDP-sugar pyrophosphorylase family protein